MDQPQLLRRFQGVSAHPKIPESHFLFIFFSPLCLKYLGSGAGRVEIPGIPEAELLRQGDIGNSAAEEGVVGDNPWIQGFSTSQETPGFLRDFRKNPSGWIPRGKGVNSRGRISGNGRGGSGFRREKGISALPGKSGSRIFWE